MLYLSFTLCNTVCHIASWIFDTEFGGVGIACCAAGDGKLADVDGGLLSTILFDVDAAVVFEVTFVVCVDKDMIVC